MLNEDIAADLRAKRLRGEPGFGTTTWQHYVEPDPAEPDPAEVRELREKALGHAVFLHGEPNMVFERNEQAAEVLKTADEFYQWITGTGE
jgi:hypothetical protein